MRILILDDNEIVFHKDPHIEHHDFSQDYIEQYRSVDMFMAALYENEWDEVWIDHDLGLYPQNGRNATLKIADRYLNTGDQLRVDTIRITSMNNSACRYMEADLHYLKDEIKVVVTPIYLIKGVIRGVSINHDAKIVKTPPTPIDNTGKEGASETQSSK